MARGDSTARAAENTGLNTFNQGVGTLMPELQKEAVNPEGMSPVDLARANTGVQQSAGGATAGATGQGALLAARTKNPGGSAAAIANAARTGGETASKGALGVNLANTQLKQEQKQAGLKGLEGISSTGIGGVAPASQANTAAVNSSYDWAKDILGPILQAAGGPATALAGG